MSNELHSRFNKEATSPATPASPERVDQQVVGDEGRMSRLGRSLWRVLSIATVWLLQELRMTTIAMWNQVLRITAWLLAECRLCLARRRARNAKVLLGEQLFAEGKGDESLRREIRQVVDRIADDKTSWLDRWRLSCEQSRLFADLATHPSTVLPAAVADVRASVEKSRLDALTLRSSLLPKNWPESMRVFTGISGIVLIFLGAVIVSRMSPRTNEIGNSRTEASADAGPDPELANVAESKTDQPASPPNWEEMKTVASQICLDVLETDPKSMSLDDGDTMQMIGTNRFSLSYEPRLNIVTLMFSHGTSGERAAFRFLKSELFTSHESRGLSMLLQDACKEPVSRVVGRFSVRTTVDSKKVQFTFFSIASQDGRSGSLRKKSPPSDRDSVPSDRPRVIISKDVKREIITTQKVFVGNGHYLTLSAFFEAAPEANYRRSLFGSIMLDSIERERLKPNLVLAVNVNGKTFRYIGEDGLRRDSADSAEYLVYSAIDPKVLFFEDLLNVRTMRVKVGNLDWYDVDDSSIHHIREFLTEVSAASFRK